jgi:hypothetical protein
MIERDGAMQRLFEAAELADVLRPVVESPQFKAWLAERETKFLEAMLSTKPDEHDLRLSLQVTILSLRDFRQWMTSGVVAGRLAVATLREKSDG